MKFWGKHKKQEQKETLWLEKLPIDTGDWTQVFSACLGKMTAIQTACGEQVVRDQNWRVDFSRGVILFGEQAYPLQLIGSEATSDDSWLWGWENINGLPESLLRLAVSTKAVGERWKLDPLTMAGFALNDTFNGHSLSVVTCGLEERYCYYRCPHSGGAVFVAFSGVPDSVFAPVDAQKFLSITMQCVQQFDIDHKAFVEGFLTWNNTNYDWKGQTLLAHFPQELKVVFEQAGDSLRICSMDTESFGK